MLVKDFIYINTLDSGSTTFENELISYFKIDTDQTREKVSQDLDKIIKVEQKIIKRKYIWFKRKLWKICLPLQEETFDQWTRMETILAENNNNKNLHKLLAIYLRPVKWYGKLKKFDMRNQDKIENDLLDIDMSTAQSILVFFSIVALKSMNYIKVFYLNQMKNSKV
jgi:hypothetical protein